VGRTDFGGDAGSGAIPLERWEGCSADELRAAWGTPEVHLYAAISSTNDAARRLGEGGAPPGTIVLAEEQTAGRGRGRRAWSSAPGLGLWISILYRPPSRGEIGPLPLHVALAAADALDPWCQLEPVGVKWPNDLMLGGRKVGGILCEGFWEQGELSHVVIGIGLNLLHGVGDFPPEIRDVATSLRLATGQPISRFEVASELVRGLQSVLDPEKAPDLPVDLGPRDVLRNLTVEIQEPESGRVIARGLARGVAADGALLLATSEGLREIRSGTARVAPDGS
jgi:BirA family transcriptional regulator, biotin operon repressor / biotin---[acetyl-CoA-carboxylase] ligase